VQRVRPVFEFFDIDPIWNYDRCLRRERVECVQNLGSRSNPAVNASVQEMGAHRMKQMTREHELQPVKAPSSGCGDGVVARNVGVKDVESIPLENRSQSKRSEQVGGIKKRKCDVRVKGPVSPACYYYVVAARAKRFD
jgi:hypothetical protein